MNTKQIRSALAAVLIAGSACSGPRENPLGTDGGGDVSSSGGRGGGSGGAGTGGGSGGGGTAGDGPTGTGGIGGGAGASSAGGAVGSGGGVGSGGAPGSGGAVGSGGRTGSGGALGSGGTVGSGGRVGTGGAVGSGGAPGSGGVVGSGGAPGTGGAPAASFVGGPCVTTSGDLTQAEVFARGLDRNIYRRLHNGTSWGAWTRLAALDGLMVDARSDLDCSATPTTVHIAVTGLSPLGSYLHAIGFGTAYNPFAREIPTSTFGPSPAILAVASTNIFRMATNTSAFVQVFEVGETGMLETLPAINTVNSLLSALDLGWEYRDTTYVVGFDNTGALGIYTNSQRSGGRNWGTPILLSPPTGATYAYSPTVCVDSQRMGRVAEYVAAVAGNRLWVSSRVAGSSTFEFSAWKQVPGSPPASAPDCTVMGDSSVHIIALDASGTVVDAHSDTSATSWTTSDLGTY